MTSNPSFDLFPFPSISIFPCIPPDICHPCLLRILTAEGNSQIGGFHWLFTAVLPSDYIRHIHHAFIIIFETRHTGLIMASSNVLVKLLPSSPKFPLFVHWRSPLPFCLLTVFISIFLKFLGYARGKYLATYKI